MNYSAPLNDIRFTLRAIADFDRLSRDKAIGEVDGELVDAVLEEAGKFAAERVAPLNRIGDQFPSRAVNGVVVLPPEWREVYQQWVEAGWGGLSGPEAHGGQALPTMVAVAVAELWNSACLAFSLNPVLTLGAVEAIHNHGSDDLKKMYLGKLVSGEWAGTMNLTEPQAGSDLNGLRTRAEPLDDGRYRLFGQKIYISYGEHELTDNICHLVLARLPDAPLGTRGISLFLVPKFLVNADGTLGERNDVYCNGVEHKLGIHSSPTCTMHFGDGKFGGTPGALGWLIGGENNGLACMFTMMNSARLNVGVQGVAIAERATQQALSYANERRQGSAPGFDRGEMAPIVTHPDVRRDLMTMKALTAAARALCFMTAQAIDLCHRAPGRDAREDADLRAGFLTPLAKSFSTDIGNQVAGIGVQVHGGMGFVEETGAAQYVRDARVLTIYEGTNGIQGIDLVMRKLRRDGGGTARLLMAEFNDIQARIRASNRAAFGLAADRLAEAVEALEATTDWMLGAAADDPSSALAGATAYQRQFSLTAAGAWLAKGAVADEVDERGGRTAIARFFCEHLLTETAGLARAVTEGAEAILNTANGLEA